MSKMFNILVVCLCLFTYTDIQDPPPQRPPVQIPPLNPNINGAQNKGSIKGIVLGKEGQGVPDLKVEVIDTENNTIVTTVTTDNEGRFTIPPLDLGSYSFRLAKEGYEPWTSSSYDLTLIDNAKVVTLYYDIPIPSPTPTPIPTPSPTAPKPTPRYTPSPTPPKNENVKVENLDFSSREQLEEWLEGQAKENRRLLRIINMGGQTGIFVLEAVPQAKQPHYLVTYEPGTPNTRNLKLRIEQNRTKTFVGVHTLNDKAYLIVFYE